MRSEIDIPPEVGVAPPPKEPIMRLSPPKPSSPIRWIIVLALFLLTAPLMKMADGMKAGDEYSHNVGLKDLPRQVSEWKGTDHELDKLSLDLLMPDDYLWRSYEDPSGLPLDFLVVYGHLKQTFHSPGFCLPGGGWQIVQKSEVPVASGGLPMEMNLFLIQRVIDGQDVKQVVMYSFMQGDNATSSLVKHNWNLLMAHFKQTRRTGALVRVIIPVTSTEDAAVARATDFITRIYPDLRKRIG